MRPFITPDLTTSGKKYFKYQCDGKSYDDIKNILKSQKLVAYELPKGHTPQAAWGLSVIFDSGISLEFSSACTHIDDWQEVGSLNIGLREKSDGIPSAPLVKTIKTAIQPVIIIGAEKIIYEDQNIVVECGIVFWGSRNQEVIISAGIPPGSVSMKASFLEGSPFEPQFPLPACRREHL